MADVELISKKSFCDDEREVIDAFANFQKAVIDKNIDELNNVILNGFELGGMFADKLSKSDFVSKIEDGTLDYSKSDIIEPTILFDDENNVSLIGDVRLTAKIHGNERRWISKTAVNFHKVNGKWCICSWDN